MNCIIRDWNGDLYGLHYIHCRFYRLLSLKTNIDKRVLKEIEDNIWNFTFSLMDNING